MSNKNESNKDGEDKNKKNQPVSNKDKKDVGHSSSSKKGVKLDLKNVEETYHPVDKTYGHKSNKDGKDKNKKNQPVSNKDKKDVGHSSSSKKVVKFDEKNLEETYHPVDKTYGHKKIDEPKTPYEKSRPEDGRGVDQQELAARLNALNSQNRNSPQSSVDNKEDKRKHELFKEKRKHYDYNEAKKRQSQLITDDDSDDDDSGKANTSKNNKQKGKQK